jgi:subtilase family serine protease
MICAKPLYTLSALTLVLGLATIAPAQANHQPLITQDVSNAVLVTLDGNTRPEVTTANDLGLVDDSMALNGLQLVMQRSPENEKAFNGYIADLHNPTSAIFHKWLTNAEIGTMFGPAPDDITRATDWLRSEGFSIDSVSPDKMVIAFSGNAGMVRTAFHTQLHNLSVNGKAHFANVNDPQMPAALAPVVKGVASLHNFMPHSLAKPRTASTVRAMAKGNGADGTGFNFISPADIATIYNFNPLYKDGITGKGQTIVLIEDSDQFSLGDWQIFRKVMGLSRTYPFGTLTASNPTGSNTCTDPGANSDDAEAALDIDWSSAAAPNAAIISAACADTTQFGGFLALQNILEGSNPPTIVSISFGEAEAKLGAADNLFINNLYQTAVAEGVSVFVSSGDEGADSADADLTNGTHGIGVSGFTSTPFNISVGGTDFGNVPLNSPGTYFSTTNLPNFQTALSYIPEIPWNDSCAGSLFTSFIGSELGTPLPTNGTGSLCNNLVSIFGTDGTEFETTASGSGGPSGCATGAPSTRSVVSGTCAGYAKPSWQSLFGVPNDGVRDIPDVSLMASNGFWVAFYAACISDPKTGAGPCGENPATWAGFGGTSISSPIWAGIQALINQSTEQSWGNSNTVLYGLAATEYGATGSPNCNSSLGNQIGTNCLFYDVTQGDMAINCTGTNNCFNSGGKFGVLSVSDTTLEPAYGTDTGWDFPTGIGTPNVTNIVNGFTTFAAPTLVKK